ncbi:hypothetical protein FRC20_004934 [Serendipita sp. 405]|nr:hypothetical protein FRC15_004446 [Serendipita sp. 397]KAG8841601.1 hypothetical protein FRC20_004934 [Serendipita sp. 405]
MAIHLSIMERLDGRTVPRDVAWPYRDSLRNVTQCNTIPFSSIVADGGTGETEELPCRDSTYDREMNELEQTIGDGIKQWIRFWVSCFFVPGHLIGFFSLLPPLSSSSCLP